jgi:hypothetical protein
MERENELKSREIKENRNQGGRKSRRNTMVQGDSMENEAS